MVMDSETRARHFSSGAAIPRVAGASQRLGIGVVKSVSQCLDILTQLDGPETSLA